MFPLHKWQKLQITIRNQRYLYILSTSSFLTVSFTSSTSTLTFLLPNWISIVSPVFTCTDALAGLSLTRTLPASHASFATVRRLIRRDTFKYLSNLIFCSCKCSLNGYSRIAPPEVTVQYLHSYESKSIENRLRRWDFDLYVSGFWHFHAKTPRGIVDC